MIGGPNLGQEMALRAACSGIKIKDNTHHMTDKKGNNLYLYGYFGGD